MFKKQKDTKQLPYKILFKNIRTHYKICKKIHKYTKNCLKRIKKIWNLLYNNSYRQNSKLKIRKKK